MGSSCAMGMGGEGEQRGPSRVGALDGLRGLAVAAVLLYHSQFDWARGGFLGVSAFFTLSGFLITSLLLAQQEQQVPLRRFWGRRARRLLPAAMLTLLGVLLFAATIATDDQLRLLRGDVIATLAYVANWRFYLSGQSYAHLFSAPSPVLHFWSLAIEEQFYLVFPLVVAFVAWATRRTSALRRRQILGAVLTAGIAASVIAGRMLYPRSGSRASTTAPIRAAELLVGALLAVILAGRITTNKPASARVRALAAVGGFGALGIMVWWWATVAQSTVWLYHGGFAPRVPRRDRDRRRASTDRSRAAWRGARSPRSASSPTACTCSTGRSTSGSRPNARATGSSLSGVASA